MSGIIRCVLLLVLLLPGLPLPEARAAEALWSALREGRAVALIRHAEAPGTGDPPAFRLGDCSTQRNLSAAGRAQAGRIGAAFRANGIPAARMLSSGWCRSHDTATLMELGEVEIEPALNSFFGQSGRRDEQTAALAAIIRNRLAAEPAVMVTHQVNITALTGVYPASGEMVVVARETLAVLGRIAAD